MHKGRCPIPAASRFEPASQNWAERGLAVAPRQSILRDEDSAPRVGVYMLSAGIDLRKIRDRLGLTMRDVENASLLISQQHGSEEYLIPPEPAFRH